jgi:protein involved in polysaccharide export with SLBB domain
MPQKHSIRFVSILMIVLIILLDITMAFAEVKFENKRNGASEKSSSSIGFRSPNPEIPVPSAENREPNLQSTSRSPFRPGDALFIDTFPDTSFILNRYFPIDDRGMAEFPMIGKLKVTDLSQEELENFLKSQYKNFMRYPNVRVKPAIRVSVVGGVNNPGFYYVDQNSSLWEVLQRAGGTTFEDGLKDMTWERSHNELNDDLIPYLEKGTSLRAMGFRSGDQLYTPTQYETFWTFFGQNILPLITFATSMYLLYYQYQRDILYFESIRR